MVTGFFIFAVGVYLCGAIGTFDPVDPSWNTATSHEPNNLFGYGGAFIADIAVQLFGWAAWIGSFLIFSAGLKRMVLIGTPDFGRWGAGALAFLATATCLAGWGIPADWELGGSLGGLVGDTIYGAARLPFAAFKLPAPGFLACLVAGIAAVALMFSAANVGSTEIAWMSRTLGTSARHYLVLAWGPTKRVLQAGARLAVRLGVFGSRKLVERLRDEPDDDADVWQARNAFDEKSDGYYSHDPDESVQTPDVHQRKDEGGAPLRPPVAAPTLRSKPFKGKPVTTGEGSLPGLDLLVDPPARISAVDEAALMDRADHLIRILSEFGVKGHITHVRPGPVVTLFELEPAAGVKSSRVISLADDIARSMSAISARVAVIPGKNAIGIELPNKGRETVYLRTLLESADFQGNKMKLPLALGEDIGGAPVCADLAKMPHLLIAGTTGSGKSVGINAMILSLMYKLPPEKCRFIMIDPKMLELSIYEGVPHLLSPVVIDPKKAVTALKWTVREMESRYEMMSKAGVRNLVGFNEKVVELKAAGKRLTRDVQTGWETDTGRPIYESQDLPLDQIPNIVVVIDEMADLMMVAGKEIEGCIQRLAQMARAAGIHLITATQRPSVDVITGTIKANFPTRMSYMVSSKIDSRTILNEQGAEQLLGMGDCLYMATGGRVQRLHGPFVSDEEVQDIVDYLKSTGEPDYQTEITEEPEDVADSPVMDAIMGGNDEQDLYAQAVAVVMRDGRASTSYVQRRCGIGYNKAASIIERMEDEGIVSAPNHSGRREVLKKQNADADH